MKFFKMLTCKQTFAMRNDIQNMNLFAKASYHFHLMICKNCQSFLKNLHIMEQGMSEQIKEKIKKADFKKIEDIEKKAINEIKNLDK